MQLTKWEKTAHCHTLLLDAYRESLTCRRSPDLDDLGSLACRCNSQFTSLSLCSQMSSTQWNLACNIYILCFRAEMKLGCSALGWQTLWSDFDTKKSPCYKSAGFLLNWPWSFSHFCVLLSVLAATDISEEQRLESRFASGTGSPTVTTAISNSSVSIGHCKTQTHT